MDDDLGRYESAVGWKAKDPYKKQREKIGKEQEKELQPSDSILELRPATKWLTRKKPPAELYGPLWREGEVAVLLGDHAAGKSILAVQLADSIAGERTLLSATPRSGVKSGCRVLYIDFQRTAAQWAERYSSPSPIPGTRPVRCRFAKNFDRAGIDWTNVDLEAYNRDPVKFALHSIFNKIEESGAKVIIIDDIQLGGANALGRKGILRTMQTLKMWAATEALSILVLTERGQSCPQRRPPASLFALADSIFTLNKSTFGPDYRYVKSIKNSAHNSQNSNDVLTYQLTRSTGPRASRLLFPSPDSCPPPPLISDSSTPFLGLQYLGTSPETDHLRDYAAEVRKRVEDAVRIQRQALDALPNDFLDVEVLKYLKS